MSPADAGYIFITEELLKCTSLEGWVTTRHEQRGTCSLYWFDTLFWWGKELECVSVRNVFRSAVESKIQSYNGAQQI